MAIYDVSVTDSFSGWSLGSWGDAGWGLYAGGATEASSVTIVVGASSAESATSSGNPLAGSVSLSNCSETATASDASVFSFSFPVSLADSPAATDATNVLTLVVSAQTSDTSAASEQSSAVYAPILAAITDSVIGGESASAVGSLNANRAETSAGSESSSVLQSQSVSVAESNIASDVAAAVQQFVSSMLESAAATAAAQGSPAPVDVSRSETVAATEAGLAFFSYAGIVNDTSLVFDVVSAEYPLSAGVSESAKARASASGPAPWVVIDDTQTPTWVIIET